MLEDGDDSDDDGKKRKSGGATPSKARGVTDDNPSTRYIKSGRPNAGHVIPHSH